VRRWGFHGASHRYLAGRTAQLLGRSNLRIITCHLGGSNSLCAIRDGQSVATSMGMSPQTGLLQNNRVGDFDPYAVPWLMQRTGLSQSQVLERLSEQGGLLGLSGLSCDVRDLEEAADRGHERAKLALDVFVSSIRQYLGAYLVELGGVDALVFSGGIGENSSRVRNEVCAGLSELGIVLDEQQNATARGESRISAETSRTQIWVVPTNEEIVIARQALEVLRGQAA
jgi:acetate kinase